MLKPGTEMNLGLPICEAYQITYTNDNLTNNVGGLRPITTAWFYIPSTDSCLNIYPVRLPISLHDTLTSTPFEHSAEM